MILTEPLLSSDIELNSLISKLDNTASDIVTYQRDSTVQRKDLAQKTKDFRKLDDAGKLAEIKGLLKGTSNILYIMISFSLFSSSQFP